MNKNQMLEVKTEQAHNLKLNGNAATQGPRFRMQVTLALLVIAGFLFRLWLMQFRFAAAYDEVNYLKLGVSGYSGGVSDVLHTYWSPFLPFLISIFCTFFDDYVLAGRMVSILAGALLAVPVYFLGKRIFDGQVGMVAAILVALFPPLVFQGSHIYTESVTMLLAACLLLCALQTVYDRAIGYALVAGALGGCLYLLHPQGIGFFIVLLAWLVLSCVIRFFAITRKQAAFSVLLLALGFVVVASPYLIYLKGETGHWTLSAKAAANWQFESYEGPDDVDPFRSLNPENTTVPLDQIYHQGTFLQTSEGGTKSVSQVRIGAFVVKYIKNVYELLKHEIPGFLSTVPMVLFSIGLLAGPWRLGQGRKIIFLMSFIVFFWFLVLPSFHIIERYLTPLWPICALFIASGAAWVHSWLVDYAPLTRFCAKRKLNTGKLAVLVIAGGFLGLSFLPELGRIVARDPYTPDYWAAPIGQKTAGLWLQENVPGPKILMSRYQTVDIYAGNFNIRESITIPDHDLERVLAYARHRGVRFLVLSERYEEDIPRIAYLFDEQAQPKGLERIYHQADRAGLRTVIFRVL